MDGPQSGQVFTLGSRITMIGRHASNQVCIHETGVSRVHARVRRVGSRIEICDLESKNGTWVDGKKVNKAQIDEGTVIQLGSTAMFRVAITTADHEQLLRHLYEFSTRDQVTGISNRRYFDFRLEAELAFASRHGTDLGLVLLDVDHFKRVNDRHGHAVGDAVLAEVARRLQVAVRSEDVVARFGGEEFAVLLRGEGVAGAVHAAERLRKCVSSKSHEVAEPALTVTVSCGCAALSEGAGTAAALITRADGRLYLAKSGGRDRVVGTGPT